MKSQLATILSLCDKMDRLNIEILIWYYVAINNFYLKITE